MLARAPGRNLARVRWSLILQRGRYGAAIAEKGFNAQRMPRQPHSAARSIATSTAVPQLLTYSRPDFLKQGPAVRSFFFGPKSPVVVMKFQGCQQQQWRAFVTSGKMDYYGLLGVPSTATLEEIKKAYLKKAKQFHPDLNPAPDAKVKFQEIGEAYSVLKDSVTRRQYDRGQHASQQTYGQSSYSSSTTGQQQQQHATGEEVFWEVWNDIGLQDYMDTLQKDVQMAFTDAVDHGNFDTLWNLAKNRKGLVFGIVLPLAAALRFPGLVIVALRTVFFLPALWVRFVPWELQVAIYAGMWKRYVEWNRSTRGSSRGQQQQQRRKKGSRPWDKPS